MIQNVMVRPPSSVETENVSVCQSCVMAWIIVETELMRQTVVRATLFLLDSELSYHYSINQINLVAL